MLSTILRSVSTNRPLPPSSTMAASQKLLRQTPSSSSVAVAHQWQRSLSILPSINTTLSRAIHTNDSNKLTYCGQEGIHRLCSNTTSHNNISSFRNNFLNSSNWNQSSSIFPLNTTTSSTTLSKQQTRQFSSNGNLGNIFQHAKNAASAKNKKPGETLEQHGIDLTALAKQGKLDPVIGRHEEIRRTLQILARRTKNNPVLIGEPGVGKCWLIDLLIDWLWCSIVLCFLFFIMCACTVISIY